MMKQSMRQPQHTPLEYQEISTIQFSAISKQQIHNFSVMQIDHPFLYENGEPAKGGLLDRRLGTNQGTQACGTCNETVQCPGHFGHIKLEEPVLHYGFIDKVLSVLRCICHRCFRLKRSSDKQIRNRIKQMRRVVDPEKRLGIMSNILKGIKKCKKTNQQEDPFDKNFKPCGAAIPNNISIKNYKICYIDESNKSQNLQRYQIKRILEGFSFYGNECEAIGFTKTKPIDLIIQSLIVVPPQVRPHISISNQIKCQDDLSIQYLKIIRINKKLKQKNLPCNQRAQLVNLMQRLAASIMVKLKPSNLKILQNNKLKESLKKIKSIQQRLKGKQGRFRQNLLGKRVDFSARTVISPDPYLDLNQLGIPQKVANTLTFPQKITALNIQKIEKLCFEQKVKFLINPPESSFRNKQSVVNVSKIIANRKEDFRPYIRFGMIAQRVLENGDYVLLNRQPTLHRMSMMAHKIRILPYNTFRINLSVCMPYNADFDGDEMNVHVPRSYQSLSELKNISVVQNQIVGPKNGTTSMGFSQDSLLGAFMITSKDTFLTRQQMMNLLTWVDQKTYIQINSLPIPTILKPQPLWSGKQLISLILPKQVTINSIKTKNKQEKYTNCNQANLIIKKGQIMTGILQKQHIGSSSSLHNIIHSIWMAKGPQQTQLFIDNLQKIVYNWLLTIGFSLGVADVIPTAQLSRQKFNEALQINKLYSSTFNSFRDSHQVKVKNLHQQRKMILDSFQYVINLQLNNHLSKVQQKVRKILSPSTNHVYKIIQAKSKGSETNLAQIMYSVGNQNINGQRCPEGFKKRSLPHFYKDDYPPTTRGYIINSYFQGLNPTEFFFHSMAGREGLSDTAVKTSHVGYLQRKLVKSLEDLVVKYDGSVRDSKNNMLQKFYGEDGFSAEFIQKHKLYGAQLKPNKFKQVYKWKIEQLKKLYKYSQKQLEIIRKQYYQLFKSRKAFLKQAFFNSESASINFQYFCPIKIQRIINKLKLNNDKSPKITPVEICQDVQMLLQECILPSQKYFIQIRKQNKQKPQKTQENKQISESFSDEEEQRQTKEFLFKRYQSKDEMKYSSEFQIFKIHLRFSLSSKILCKTHQLSRGNFKQLIKQVKQLYFKSLAPAGEAVGCIASQSIGEPTTQMTLNTFHLAGISDRNVTLGLPRLQQVLSCAKNVQYSSITIFPRMPVLEGESSVSKNRNYLLDLLSFQFNERKIRDFIKSIHYHFNPQLLQQKRMHLNQLKQGERHTAWVIQLVFNHSTINNKKLWEQIVDKIQSKALSYEIDDILDYNEASNQISNPRVSLRLIQSSAKIKAINSEGKQYKVISLIKQIESNIQDTVICGIKGIKSVKLSKKAINISQQIGRKEFVTFQAIGSNAFKRCLSNFQVNSNRTYCNNVQEVYQVLGIEAARMSLIHQFKQVLKPYGIFINYRHISVLADWMCMRGVLTSVNRFGLKQLKSLSTITKASFQSSTKTLFDSAAFSHKDQLKDTSQKIIFGQSILSGTSECQLMVDPLKCSKFICRMPQTQPKISNDFNVQQFKTPQYETSETYEHSTFDNRNLHNSYVLGTPNKSPVFMTSPLMTFSPSCSPIPSQYKLSSPIYNNGGRTDYTARNSSPLYQKYINTPAYDVASRQMRSPTPQRNFSAKKIAQKKEQDCDQQTQKTSKPQTESKNEDEF